MAAKQIPLNSILPAIDRKDRNFYNNLEEDYKKVFSPYLMLKFASSVIDRDPDVEQYYIVSTNEAVNPHLLETPISQHPQLQWLLMTAVSPSDGTKKHKWIKAKTNKAGKYGPIKKILAEMHPTMKDCDLDRLSKLVTKRELTQYAKDSGNVK